MANGVALRGWRAHATFWGGLAAFVVHVGLAFAVSSVLYRPRQVRPPVVFEVNMVEKQPIPPEPPPPEPKPEPKVEPAAPAPRVASRRPLAKPPELLPRPNREVPPAPPGAEPPPVGNTLMTKDRTPAKTPPAPLPPAPDPNAFAPVADNLICEHAARVVEVKPDYPPEARRLQIEGQVKVRVAVDRQGNVRWSRVVKSAGYGRDEAAKQGAARTPFKPAHACDGRVVDQIITLTYTFRLSD